MHDGHKGLDYPLAGAFMSRKSRTPAETGDPRRQLASVAALLEQPRVKTLAAAFTHDVVRDAIRDVLEAFRASLAGGAAPPSLEAIVDRVEAALHERESERLRPVVNATGILLHTGLGRAVLPPRAVDALAGLKRCCNLQIDLETGLRGKRNFQCEQLLVRLTGAEAALLVNNNAAATLLVLAALCAPREVIVSRGQLIEIGGSFRLPDCIHQSGARLVEVGTTNKTHLRDYEQAITSETAAILRVNPSNYRIVGFAKNVPIDELVALKRQHPSLLVIDDLGCGALVDLTRFGLPKEPTAPESIAAGADLALFSGDKLIGGPQAGIIVGRKDLVARLKKHPLSRMLRVGKMTDMALEQTLRLFLDPDALPETNPTYAMLTAPLEALRARAEHIQQSLESQGLALALRIAPGESATGGGSLPATPIPTFVLAVSAPNVSADRLSLLLRRHEPPIIARIERDEVCLDMRTLLAGEDEIVADALSRIGQAIRGEAR